MDKGNILNEIAFDKEAGTLCTKVWSSTEARAKEKALNRIVFKARSMGRSYSLIEEVTAQQPDPNDLSQRWRCITKALLI